MDAPEDTRDFAKALRRRLTLPEGLLWRALKGRKANGLQFRRQHPVGSYVLDFYCASARLAVEVDGAAHGASDRPQRDLARDAWLADKSVRTLRIPATAVLEDVDGVVRTILAAACGEI